MTAAAAAEPPVSVDSSASRDVSGDLGPDADIRAGARAGRTADRVLSPMPGHIHEPAMVAMR